MIEITSDEKPARARARWLAGCFLFIAAAQYLLAILIAESIYAGYSVRQNFESDLGNWSLDGNNAAVYNVSSVLLGGFMIGSAYYLQRSTRYRRLPILLAVAGASILITGVFSEDISSIAEGFFSFIAFIAIISCAVRSHKFVKSSFAYVLVFFGAMSLVALILFVLGQFDAVFFLGIGRGGMEGLAVYPLILWVLGYSAFLMGESAK
jgi:hypothetical membrane protein